MPIYLNRHQPIRPGRLKTGERLMFRTHPKVQLTGGRTYRTCELDNMICQIQLYRWSRSPEFTNFVGIANLHEFLMRGIPERIRPSKKSLGATVMNAIDYDCRRLKGRDKNTPKTIASYYFNHAEELQYGLEYQICAWLRRFLIDEVAPEDQPSGRSGMEEELDILAFSEPMEILENYIQPLLEKYESSFYEEPNWRELLRRPPADEEPEPEEALEKEETIDMGFSGTLVPLKK